MALESFNDASADDELKLALQLSLKSYEEELRKRVGIGDREDSAVNDLINWEDEAAVARREQIEGINRLFGTCPSGSTTITATPPCISTCTHGAEWCTIRFPKSNSYHVAAVQAQDPPSMVPSSSVDKDGLFPQNPRIYNQQLASGLYPLLPNSPPPPKWIEDVSTSWQMHLPSSIASNNSLIVPFRPLSTRLANGDLIDLGGDASQQSTPLSYEQLRSEFDPLYIRNARDLPTVSSVSAAINSLSIPRSSRISEQNGAWIGNSQHLERSQSINSTHMEIVSRPSPSAPRKPPRLQKADVRSGWVDSKRLSFPGDPLAYADINSLVLKPSISEIDREIEALRRRGPCERNPIAERFISPVLDYLITFKVTSVKVIVEKDYSWPSDLGSDQRMTFTCETKSMVGEILANVLNTFLDPAQIELFNGRLPVDEYGLKIYGLDEFLLNSSLLGENPFVGQALAFGKDIRLEVGRICCAQLCKIAQQLDTSSVEDNVPNSSFRNAPKKPAVATLDMVQKVIDAVKKEMNNCAAAFSQGNASKSRLAVHQSIKLLCLVLGRITTHELSDALRSYLAASTSEQLAAAAHKLAFAVHNFIGIYCRSVRCNFNVQPLTDCLIVDEERKLREVVGIEECLLVHVDSVHNIPPSFSERFHAFYVAIYVMHGTAELCRGFKESPRPITEDQLFPYCRTNAWAAFDLPFCILPRETRIFILLYGVCYVAPNQLSSNAATATSGFTTESPTLMEQQLACGSFPLFDHEGMLRQGSMFLSLNPIHGAVVQPWGPRPLFETGDLVALVNLPQFHFDIIFPHVGFGESSTKRDFDSLDTDTQQYLLDIIDGGVTHSLSQDEKEMLWEKRHYLTHIPEALPLVLASAVGWDWASLNNIYQLVDDWTPLNPVQAIELLLPHFPDLIIREKAISWLKNASSDFLFNFLPELVEALRFESFENSTLASYLMSLSAGDRRFAFELYWQLQQRVDHCSDRSFGIRCVILQNEMFEVLDNRLRVDIDNEHRLLRTLNAISNDMKDAGENSRMYSVLQRHLSLLDARILENNVRLPILPSFLCTGVNVSESNFFNSLTKPMKISFKGLKSSYAVLYKVGDDMRQDALVLQLVKMMNDIWLSQGLDLRLIIFRCLPIGNKKGLVELVPDCRTLREIQSAQGAAGVFKDDVLKNWLEKQNPSEFQYKIALENFQLSCAGWCVATYVLGIGDRHNDNILVTTTGHVFHIDFGKYMGDWQMAAGFRRDRVPFIFTSEMAYVINEGSSQSATGQYQLFVDNCCKAFNLLRRKYSLLINLMKLMSCSDIPGMDMEAVNFVQNNLLLNLSDTEATVQFTRMIDESLRSKFPRLNFFAHTLVQLKNSPSMIRGGYDDPNKLSFVPQLFTEQTDGRIEKVSVIASEKWHTPEKVYMYKLQVKRVGEAVCTIVYRSFAEFNELYVKLCRRFPIARLPPLSRGSNVGRSNIRSVAERRQVDIQQFLYLLFDYHVEIAHCDLVYTFFHMIFRDSAPEESNRLSEMLSNNDAKISASVTGCIFLRIRFHQQKHILSIFVGHVKGLKRVNGQAPDSYVKTYLHPGTQRTSKRKTRVVKNTQTPTFNEELYYQLDSDTCLYEIALEVSVWNCGSIVGENSMIGTIHIPLKRLRDLPQDRKGVKVLESWFLLSGYSKH